MNVMNFLLVLIIILILSAILWVLKKTRNKKILSEADIKEFLNDVTSNDALTITALDASLKDPKSIPFEFDKEFQTFAHITHSLNTTKRVKQVDWAEGEMAILDYFSALFELNGIKIPDNIEYYLIEKESDIKRGEAAELVPTLLRNAANKDGYEILNINGGDDQYRFVLSPLAAARKWNNASVGKALFAKIEIAKGDVPADFTTFKSKKQRRAPRSKLVRHLQKQNERASRSEDYKQIFIDKKVILLDTLEKAKYEKTDSSDFRISVGDNVFSIALFDFASKSLGNNYFVNNFDAKAYALGLYYRMLSLQIGYLHSVKNQDRLSLVRVPTYVMFSIIGKLSGQTMWSYFANPYIQRLLDSENKDIQTIVAQFPLMSLLVETENLTDKAHNLLSTAYEIDTRAEPDLLYEAMIEDRIRYTKLLPDLYTSIYVAAPFNFLPLEILYVSTLIDLPLSKDLIVLRDKLRELPIETDEGIFALEKYLSLNGK